jgi:zinc protease
MKSARWALALALLIAFATPALSADLPPINHEKYELPNGLDVILHVDKTIPTVTVNIWYHVGSKNEEKGRTGFAHLFEHMMFQGSKHHDTDYFAPLEKVGGEVNGSTSEDRTNYYETVPSNYLELALWLEADRMGYLLPAMTQERLDNQRDVVKNERREGVDNQPYGRVWENLGWLMYPEEHPYNWPVIGYMEDLSAASLEDVQNFFKLYYAPNNASLCVTGDFDPAEAKALIEKYFAAIPAGQPIMRKEAWIPELDGIRRGQMEDAVSLARVYYAFPSPGYYTPGDAELDILANALTNGKTSRLYKSLVYDKQIAQDVAAFQSSSELCGNFIIQATAREGHTLAELEAALDAELKKILAEGITATELANTQAQLEAGFVRSLEDLGRRADKLNEYNVFLGDPDKFEWDLDRYQNATVAGVNAAAKRWIDLDRRVIFHVLPQGTYVAAEDKLDRSIKPTAAADPSFTPPAIQKDKLSNGVEVWLVQDDKLPLVQTNIVFKGGWALEPAGKAAVGSMTSDMMDEGTKTRTALQISEEAKSIGANLGTGSSFDNMSVSLNVLKKYLDRGYALLADILMNPTFPQEELDRQKKMYMGRIAQESKQPNTVVQKTFLRTLYGADHPYGRPFTGSGTKASINAITRDDLVAFHQANYVPSNAAIAVAGNITMAEAKAALEKAFKGWASTAPAPVVNIPDPAPVTKTQVVIVDKPGAPQSAIMVGHAGIKRSDPDYMPIRVMMNVLGSQFTSRINMNLREDKGYTYGAFGNFAARRGTGPFLVTAQVQTPNTKEAVFEFVKELRDIISTRPVSAEELEDAKNDLIKSFPSGFESIGAVAGGMSTMFSYDLPLDEWQTFAARVNAVDLAAANRAATNHINPDALLIVIVGDRAKIEEGIKSLNLGDVAFVLAEE